MVSPHFPHRAIAHTQFVCLPAWRRSCWTKAAGNGGVTMGALGLLVVRLVVGGLLAGHGAQKLFGAFGGSGIEGTTKFLGKLGVGPADTWARVGGMAELTAGSLTAAGLLSPIGPTIAFAPMTVAWAKAHRGRPIWVTEGGAELPATNLAAASALLFTGPGALSLDRLLGIRV